MNEKINQMLSYLTSLDHKAIDFFPVINERAKLLSIVGEEQIKHLKVLGRNLSDCLIVLWNKQPDYTKWNDCPVAWLDSEGSPNAIFAKNTSEFLQLLYFNTGFIYDVLGQVINEQYIPKTETELQLYVEAASKTYPYYLQFTKFLNDGLKIIKPSNPDLIIKSAYENNKSFLGWL